MFLPIFLLFAAQLHTDVGIKSVCRIYADPFLEPFNRDESYAMNSEILPPAVYDLLRTGSVPGIEPFTVKVEIGFPYMMGGVGCGWNPNYVAIVFTENRTTIQLFKTGDVYITKPGEQDPTILDMSHTHIRSIGNRGAGVLIQKNNDYVTMTVFYPTKHITIKVKGVTWNGHVWGRITVLGVDHALTDGGGLCYENGEEKPPTSCSPPVTSVASRRFKRSEGGLKSPKKENVLRWKINSQDDCSRLRGTKKWACKNRSRSTRSLDQLPIVYTYPPGTNVTETVEIHTRTRRYVHAINVDQSEISRVCNKVKDPSGPFAVCVNSGDFNAANQFLVCEAMLNGMGTDQPTSCVVLSQIAANCQDVVDGFDNSVWRSAVGC